MRELVDLAEVTVVEILFGDLCDKGAQQRLIFRQDRAEQTALPIFQRHPLFKLLRIRAYRKPRFVVAAERRQIEGDVQQGKLAARRQQRMNVEPLDLRAIHHQVRDLHQQLAERRNIQGVEPAATADLAAFDRLNNQIARQRHVKRRKRHRRLFVRLPLYAAFAQQNHGTEQRVLLHHDAQLLRPGAVCHALHQQPFDARLRQRLLYPIDDRLSRLLHFRGVAQIEHHALYLRLMRDIGRAQLERHGIADTFGDSGRIKAVAGNPGRKRRQSIRLQHRLHLMGVEGGDALRQRLRQELMRLGAVLRQAGGQRWGFAQLFLVATVLHLMHKSRDRAFRSTPGRNARLSKGAPRRLRGELAAPVSQQRYLLAARMGGNRLNDLLRRFGGGRYRAGRMDNH